MASWSYKSNLALNPVKTKQMVLSTNQLARVHDLKHQITQMEIWNRRLESLSETKLLEVKRKEILKWNDHVKDVANASYGVLRTLRKLGETLSRLQPKKETCRITCVTKTRLL